MELDEVDEIVSPVPLLPCARLPAQRPREEGTARSDSHATTTADRPTRTRRQGQGETDGPSPRVSARGEILESESGQFGSRFSSSKSL